MPINLANVSISLAQFQEISSGKYNAGEVKLSGETSLAKMNNHVHFRGKNVETISHEETIAIKEALVRALASNGVGEDAVNAVRRELGLAPDGEVDRTLAERSMKPLTRQQVREILDRNAAAINAQQGAGTIRTSEEIHSRRSMSKIASLAATREATNAALDGSRAVTESTSILLAQTVIAGDVDFHSRDERASLLDTAIEQKKLIMERSGGHPSTDPDASISVETSGGHSVTLKLGMSEADYVGKLDDMILRLRGGRAPAERDLAARAEFKALSSDSARAAWLSDLSLHSSSGANGAKARAVAVMLLQERGVDDFAILSLVNQIGDEPAALLVNTLLKDTSGRTGDAFRQSGLLQRFVDWAKANPATVPADAQAFIPALSPKEFNEAIFHGLANDASTLPESFAQMAREVRDEVVARLGEGALTAGGPIEGLVDGEEVSGMIDRGHDGVARVTSDSLRAGYLEGAMKQGAKAVLQRHVADVAAQSGAPIARPKVTVNMLLARKPDLVGTLAACQTPDDVAAALDGVADDLADVLACERTLERCDALAQDEAVDVMAWQLDVSAEDLSKPGVLNLSAAGRFIHRLDDMIADGKLADPTPEKIEAAFHDLVDAFAAERAETLHQVSSLPLSMEACNGLCTTVLQMNKTDYLNFDDILAAASEVDFTEIVSLIDAKAEPEKVFAAMDKLSKNMLGVTAQVLSGAKGEVGGDEQGFIATLVYQVAIDKTPGGVKALETFFARKDVPVDVHDYTQKAFAAAPFREILTTRAGEGGMHVLLSPLERTFLDGAGAVRAAEAGYYKSELPQLAHAYSLCVAAGMSPDDALAAVTDPLSKPMRLFNYGGRFTASIDGFKKGLALMDGFRSWFEPLCDNVRSSGEANLTSRNASVVQMRPENAGTIERFLFEEIAINGDIPLDTENFDNVFGMENNPAMRFVGRLNLNSYILSLAHVPPERRELLYSVLDAVEPVTARGSRASYLYDGYAALLTTRALVNYDAVAALRANGQLDHAHVMGLLFPEFPDASTWSIDDFNKALGDLEEALQNEGMLSREMPEGVGVYGLHSEMSMTEVFGRLLEGSGAPVKTVLDAIKNKRSVPTAPHVTSFKTERLMSVMAQMDSPAQAERAAMFDVLRNPQMPILQSTGQGVLAAKDNRSVFNFPDGTLASATDAEHLEEAERALTEKIESLCGAVHQQQIAGVYRALSQNGRGPMVDAFLGDKILTDSYCPLSHTITKDEATGAITIRFSQPEGFPRAFSWETTIALDGSATSTPLVRE